VLRLLEFLAKDPQNPGVSSDEPHPCNCPSEASLVRQEVSLENGPGGAGKHPEARTTKETKPVVEVSLAHFGQESTEKEKTANCSGCGHRFPRRELVEVHEEHTSYGYGVRIGERYCRSCARATGVISFLACQ